ncbi:MAG: hypothetical protein D6714_10410, partial [Bacteroidetes bacterium]
MLRLKFIKVNIPNDKQFSKRRQVLKYYRNTWLDRKFLKFCAKIRERMQRTGVTFVIPPFLRVFRSFFLKDVQTMTIHLIALGGAVMHNLALALHHNGHQVTGSDDEFYEPSRSRLAHAGLLPEKTGWHPDRITPDLDAVILGMHARADNPELRKAQDLGLPIYSFPAFIHDFAKDKQRVVIAGSHGKTTTTAMILHVLNYWGKKFDYLVGAQLNGFERMVQLSDAPVIILEGDEYLSSALDPRPKFVHYRPHIAVLTGIAWDHMNVFPTFENYVSQFELLLESMEKGGTLFFYGPDPEIRQLLQRNSADIIATPYRAFNYKNTGGQAAILRFGLPYVPLKVFGQHNLSNLKAAHLVCLELGITDDQFFEAIQSFEGAAKRLDLFYEDKENDFSVYKDFAHAPSKVRATVSAVKEQYPNRQLTACLELHTYSSLNQDFLPQYQNTLDLADVA